MYLTAVEFDKINYIRRKNSEKIERLTKYWIGNYEMGYP